MPRQLMQDNRKNKQENRNWDFAPGELLTHFHESLIKRFPSTSHAKETRFQFSANHSLIMKTCQQRQYRKTISYTARAKKTKTNKIES